MAERPDSDEVILSTGHDIAPVGAPAQAEDPAEITPHSAVKLLLLEVVDSHEAVLTADGYVFSIGREGKAVYGSVTDGPAVEKGRLVFGFDSGNDCVLQLRVWQELYGACGFTCEDCVPEIEVAAAMGGDKLSLRTRDPLDTGDT